MQRLSTAGLHGKQAHHLIARDPHTFFCLLQPEVLLPKLLGCFVGRHISEGRRWERHKAPCRALCVWRAGLLQPEDY